MIFKTLSGALLVWSVLPQTPGARSSEGPAFARYAVAADHVEASEAGASVLAQGGNAADAAAATMLALGVVSPASSGLGGGGFALYYRAKDKSLTFLDFREMAPSRAQPDMFEAREGDTPEQARARSQRGGLAVAVPGEPRGIAELVRRFGKKPLSLSVRPAERLARLGFVVTPHTERMVGYTREWLSKEPAFARVFGPPLPEDRKVKNPALASTLRQFASQGDALFYRGALARQMAQAAKRAGGVLEPKDLAKYQLVTRAPLRDQALGYDWVTAPPPSAGGYTIVQSLRMLERVLGSQLPGFGVERAHALIESWKGPYLDRMRYFGDPSQVEVPLAALLDPARSQTRGARFKKGKARPSGDYDLPLAPAGEPAKPQGDRGTSHLCVVDEEGNIAAVTTTVNLPFGSGVSVGGFWLNNEMDDFAREVGKENAFGLVGGAPNLPAPGKRPVSSMVPTIVFQGDAPVLCIGGSGGSRIPTAVEQVALYVLSDGMHPTQAASAPRLHHQADPEQVDVRDVPEPVRQQLAARGHKLNEARFSAHVQAIRIGKPDAPRLLAGSDPHKAGEPRGQ